MKIDFNTVVIAGHTGYGNASRLLVESLGDRGISVCSGSDVMLNFCMPRDYKYSKHTVGYTPWESTEVPDDWMPGLMKADCLVSPSSWSAEVLSNITGRYVQTIPHGIDACWSPAKRYRKEVFTFIHTGEPAVRKGGQLVLEAWGKAFADRKDVRLIYKCNKYAAARIKDSEGSIVYSPGMFDNVQVLSNVMTQEEMWELYFNSDCMVYPSQGEGFGLIPFEAMATGLPVIAPAQGGTRDFTQYHELSLHDTKWVRSPEEDIHPGLWMEHSVDELIDKMRFCVDNYDYISEYAFKKSHQIHLEYSWDSIAEQFEILLCGISGVPTRSEQYEMFMEDNIASF